jgi:hypothetical protein
MKKALVALALSALATPAWAIEEPDNLDRPDQVKEIVVMLGLFDLVAYPALDLTGEIRLTRISGLSVHAGYGNREAIVIFDIDTPPALDSGDALNIGAGYRYYLYGSLDIGLQVGGDAQYMHWMDSGDGSFVGGLFVGGKYTFPFGLAGELQLGAAAEMNRDDIDFGERRRSVEQRTRVGLGPLINVNVGWGF